MTRQEAIKLLAEKEIDIQKEKVVLFGLRNKSIGKYDDELRWIGAETEEYFEFTANTDPSKHYQNVATLVGDAVYKYKIGKHGYNRPEPEYDAFRQAGAVEVDRYRYGNKFDRQPLGDSINIHRGGKNTTSSAGCQTLPPELWDEFRRIGYGLLKKYGKEKSFLYYLKEAK